MNLKYFKQNLNLKNVDKANVSFICILLFPGSSILCEPNKITKRFCVLHLLPFASSGTPKTLDQTLPPPFLDSRWWKTAVLCSEIRISAIFFLLSLWFRLQFLGFLCFWFGVSEMGSRKEEERNEKIIRGLMKLPPNRRCINCNSLVSSTPVFEFDFLFLLIWFGKSMF